MQNISGFPQTWSEQTITEYRHLKPAGSENFNTKWWGVTALNPKSVYPKGYHVRSGPEENPAFVVDDGKLRVHWNDIMQEVWIDCPSGWLAAVNGETGYTVVMRHKIDPTPAYPGEAHRSSSIRAGRRANDAIRITEPREGPFVEAEMNSPRSSSGRARATPWTRMVSDAHGRGLQDDDLQWCDRQATYRDRDRRRAGTLRRFGVFYAGDLVAHFYGRGGGGTAKLMSVIPTEPVHLQTTIQAPPNTTRVSVHLVDSEGLDRGPLGEVLVNPPPRDVRDTR